MTERQTPIEVAKKLADFYDQSFGGKSNGRYRISPKNLRRLAGRRRISEEFKRLLAEEMFEEGYVFIDMDTFYVVINARSFTNYRRLADALIG
ncbi:MAG: hypothetical protein HQ502_04605 [Alphaproteobacteria bacterium]|nr:hypothetical protein [Alphaproteobacteria bacterium]